jgi:hypothetical protein
MITARLFTYDGGIAMQRTTRSGDPAILVLPHGGLLRDPHLLVVAAEGEPPGRRVVTDRHVVMDDPGTAGCGADRRELADVLIVQSACDRTGAVERATTALARYPGSGLVIAPFPGGCRAAFPGGAGLDISDAAGRTVAEKPWPALFGSFLHCWLAARIPLEELEPAAVLYGTASGDRLDALAVAGRVQIRSARRMAA